MADPSLSQSRESGNLSRSTESENQNNERPNPFKELLALVATVIASVTYTAGLTPPGGFWQDDTPVNKTKQNDFSANNTNHFSANTTNQNYTATAGDPVLGDKNLPRYTVFLIFNSSAFVTSLIATVLLLKHSYFKSKSTVKLQFAYGFLLGSIFSLAVAFYAGSTSNISPDLTIVFFVSASISMFFTFLVWIYAGFNRFKWVQEVFKRVYNRVFKDKSSSMSSQERNV